MWLRKSSGGREGSGDGGWKSKYGLQSLMVDDYKIARSFLSILSLCFGIAGEPWLSLKYVSLLT